MKAKTHRLLLLGMSLICVNQTLAESVCYKESEVNDHFESLEIRYAWVSEDSIHLNVSVWNIGDSVNMMSCGIYHVLAISSDDLDRDARFGKLGPARRAEPVH